MGNYERIIETFEHGAEMDTREIVVNIHILFLLSILMRVYLSTYPFLRLFLQSDVLVDFSNELRECVF